MKPETAARYKLVLDCELLTIQEAQRLYIAGLSLDQIVDCTWLRESYRAGLRR